MKLLFLRLAGKYLGPYNIVIAESYPVAPAVA
jgi:hypothetical protein